MGRLLKGSWNVVVYPEQWEASVNTIVEKDPQSIALNYSKDFGLADGLVHTEYETFYNLLPAKYQPRVVSAERLAIGWLVRNP